MHQPNNSTLFTTQNTTYGKPNNLSSIIHSFILNAYQFNNAITTQHIIKQFMTMQCTETDTTTLCMRYHSFHQDFINSLLGIIWIHRLHPVGPTINPRRLHHYFMAHDVMDRLHPHGPTINVTVRSHPTRAHDRYLQDSHTGINHKPLLMSTIQ